MLFEGQERAKGGIRVLKVDEMEWKITRREAESFQGGCDEIIFLSRSAVPVGAFPFRRLLRSGIWSRRAIINPHKDDLSRRYHTTMP
jgi:hypothetical protein